MIELDQRLIFEAQRIIDATNVHRLKGMIFAYQQAVLLHNSGWPTHARYHLECEQELRQYIVRQINSASNLRSEGRPHPNSPPPTDIPAQKQPGTKAPPTS